MRVVRTAKPYNHLGSEIGHSKGSKDPDTSMFQSLILKHDRAYVNVESEESMCVIMKCDVMDGMK